MGCVGELFFGYVVGYVLNTLGVGHFMLCHINNVLFVCIIWVFGVKFMGFHVFFGISLSDGFWHLFWVWYSVSVQ